MTRTYSTTNIVIDAVRGWVWAEDFAHDTFAGIQANPFLDRAGTFIDKAHAHAFESMATFTDWLQEMGAVVDQCTILGETLSEAERKA